MENCGNCVGCSCESCGGCLELTAGELQLLEKFGQLAFLPVGRRADDMTPIYSDGDITGEEAGTLFLLLERKRLISLDYDLPLKAFAEDWYTACPVRGSAALTQRGQLVLERIHTQGIQ